MINGSPTDNPIASPSIGLTKRWYLLLAMVLSLIMCNIDRNVLSVLLEPIKQEFKLQDWQLGLLAGLSFTTLYCVGSLVVSRVADRYDRIWIVSGALFAWSLLTFLCGQAGSFVQLLLARSGVGLTESGSQAPAHALIADHFEGRERPLAMGIYASGAVIGFLLALPIGGYLEHLWGWRGAFAAVSIPGILLAMIIRLTLRDPRRARPILDAAVGGTFVSVSRSLLENRCNLHLILAGTVAMLPGSAELSFGVSILVRARGLTPAVAGEHFGLATGLCAIVGAAGSGWLVSRLVTRDHRWRCWVPMIAELVVTPFWLAFLFLPNVDQAIFAGALGAGIGSVWLGPLLAALQDCAGPLRRATAAALLLVSYNFVGSGLGPLLAGVLSDLFHPRFGDNSLGMSLVALQPFNVWAGIHLYLASRHLPLEGAA